MDHDLFLPNISPNIINCYHTKLFKLLFYVFGIIFYVSDEDPNIPKKFCAKKVGGHTRGGLCRVCKDPNYIVLKYIILYT
jgi:hypothetical protein